MVLVHLFVYLSCATLLFFLIPLASVVGSDFSINFFVIVVPLDFSFYISKINCRSTNAKYPLNDDILNRMISG